jgi:photosystem II stability/assembly factor-like uncharacterized protein
MTKHLVAVALAAAALTAHDVAPSHHRVARETRDSRRVGPGIHRAGPAELAVLDRVTRAESDKIAARQRLRLASVPATSWVSVGPTDAAQEFNDFEIHGVDSGRPSSILVDPRDPDVVYLAASGGGVWKTYDLLASTGPTWVPLTDTLPNLAAGVLALDPDHPDTLYLGTGDFIDTSGNTILKSTDGGGTWSAPVMLAGMYPAPNNGAANVSSVRAIGVNGNLVLAGTDAGLFVSQDAGATFQLVDLPDRSGHIVSEAIWSIVSTGGGHWVATGVTGCTASGDLPPIAFGSDPNSNCVEGNDGVIWTSADGLTWSISALPRVTDIGRITVAAGPTTDPAHTVLYAMVGAVDGQSTAAFWRSMDGGATWQDATGLLANPTLDAGGSQDCATMDIGHGQSWYNQAIVVDPTNADHVLVGGNLCGARTLNGTAPLPSWEIVSDWLPNPMTGATAAGLLPYVHADWHAATSIVEDGGVRTFAGTDGGIFSSTDLFASKPPEQVTWTHHNRGLTTHLFYSLASGDPSSGNPFVLFGGLQDNGTRFRVDPHTPSVFNQPVGGDGIGATVHTATSGTTYWTSFEFGRLYCQPSATVTCTVGDDWTELEPTLNEESDHDRESVFRDDSEPFFEHFANVETDKTGQNVLTHSDGQVFVSALQSGNLTWLPISQDLTNSGHGFANVTASRAIAHLYGAAGTVSAAPFFTTTTGNTPAVWKQAQPVRPVAGTARLTGPSSIDFPPVTPAGKNPGDVFIGSFTGTLNDALGTPPPDDKGHLYRTTDGGQTWTSIVGADPAHRLPNVSVFVVKYDPVTPTTIYAGTLIGVYISTDDGATWDRMGDGMPMVPVRDMYIAKNQEFIRVATYGRGLWEIYPSAAENPGATGDGDYDRNLRLDWIDLAAMSARLGETPATTTRPFYSWILDMTSYGVDPPTAVIDDSDLTTLLAGFGGHP